MSEVRLIAVSKAGKKAPLILLAPEWNNTFVTGQHIDSNDPTTADNLTPDQIMQRKTYRGTGGYISLRDAILEHNKEC